MPATDQHVLLAGQSHGDIAALAAALAKIHGIRPSTRILGNGHTDPLHDVTSLPEVLILMISANWEEEFKALAARPASMRPPTLVVGPTGDAAIMRTAMQVGARDYLAQPVILAELTQALRHIAEESRAARAAQSRVIAVMNAKGGSGASLIAANLAHIAAAKRGARTALLDFDIQFGSLAHYFDIQPRTGVLEALGAAEQLDAVALEGYMMKHPSGLHLLAAPTRQLVLPGEIAVHSIQRLLEVATRAYQEVILDLPRLIEPATIAVMDRADQVIVVMQQSLASMRDAKRLLGILRQELEMPEDKAVAVVNRYIPQSSIATKDIESTLGMKSPVLIPNDFKRVRGATDIGMPLYDYAPNAAVTKALVSLSSRLGGEMPVRARRGLLRRARSLFSANA